MSSPSSGSALASSIQKVLSVPPIQKALDLLLGINDPADRKELLATGAGVIVGSKRAAFLEIWSKGVRGRTALGAFLNVFQQLAGM
ncbi:hypothetical protein BCR35DRAFT_329221 [Leucosporidium creatinivorum]|uniref:Uncharacterized protein n=1 Tax=Leucosporidium creatinivorum TaxID=106004 RepID=A0A1Y2FYT2_9BASI|nr:hypothetical protein BCR35DRAFT_329221 [Leucosporidium creatinivorum]